MDDPSTRQRWVKEIFIVQYMPPLVDYSLYDLKEATNNFAKQNEVAYGGSSTVFRAVLANGEMKAVKNFHADKLDIFLNELEIQGLCWHQIIMRLHGYCTEEKQMLWPLLKTRKESRLFSTEGSVHALVFEYMGNRDLNYFLHGDNCLLDWPTRFNIILGISRGMLYLHYNGPCRIAHCNIKPSNILLDDYFCPKITDFGVAELVTGVLTSISLRGTVGYIDPEFFNTGILSLRIDVYNFGVVLLEIVSGRLPVDFFVEIENYELSLTAWVRWMFETTSEVEEVVEELLDPKLMKKTYPTLQVFRVVHVALLCLQLKSRNLPTMIEVLYMLQGEMDLKPILEDHDLS